MRRNAGDKATPVALAGIDGKRFDSAKLQGKAYMLSFFRFAACPFCNMRMHELATRYNELGGKLQIVAVFDSPPGNLKKYAARHEAPFPVLADENNIYYKAYGIEKSLLGVAKGVATRFPMLMTGLFVKGYLPMSFKGSLITMPADFLIDANGIIRLAYYGKDEGDHLPFDEVKQFSQSQGEHGSSGVGRKQASVAG